MTDKITRTKDFFNGNITELKNEMLKLKADGRQDESVFARVKMNVYDIFNTVFLTAIKLNLTDEKEIKEFFLTKLSEIPSNWNASLIKAKEHGETEKAHTEELKLGAAKDIEEKFRAIWTEE